MSQNQAEHVAAQVRAEVRAEMGRQDIDGATLAARLQVSEMWVSRRIRGKTRISVTDLARIAAALGMPIGQFIATPERAA